MDRTKIEKLVFFTFQLYLIQLGGLLLAEFWLDKAIVLQIKHQILTIIFFFFISILFYKEKK